MGNPKPRRLSGKVGFVLDLVNPNTGKRTARGLATDDPEEAEQIAHDYKRLQERPDLLNNSEKHILELLGFHPKSLDLAFGKNHPVLERLRELQSKRSMNPIPGSLLT